ncbi:probable global transcription activator SNF2L1 [Culicoides brevitarsis]|uniref:probable global transcription activator SNF2L1 n=1 Tax=Culicoides brevitarsis TaxID=469753 RepID=UPI00307B96F7
MSEAEKMDNFTENDENMNLALPKSKIHDKRFDELFQQTCNFSRCVAALDEGHGEFHETPDYIKGGEMRDYQLRGLNWMITLYKNDINGILADEMGLGKTLQTISMIGYLKHFRKIDGPFLVVVPLTVVQNWLNEFAHWCPTIRTVSIIGHKETRKRHIQKVVLAGNWDVCVTSYEMCKLEKSVMKKFHWHYLVVDEAHRIKRESTGLSLILREFRSDYRLLLTGTPLQNNLHELWALLNFLLPHVFDSSEDFDTWFNTENCLADSGIVEKLKEMIKALMLRRIKNDVEKSLLPKEEIKLYVGLSEMQREWYKKILLRDIDVFNGLGERRKKQLVTLMQHLRQCCDHPFIFEGAEGEVIVTDQRIIDNSGKMVVLDKLLHKLRNEGSRVLIFCQFLGMMDILEDYCAWRGYEYCRLDGSTKEAERTKLIAEFNAPNSKKFLFLISTRAGGLGINLTTADSVVIYHSDWNPQADNQAIDRAHRIGQKKQVRVFRLIAENTIEERIDELAQIKSRLDQTVIHGRDSKNPSAADLMKIVRLTSMTMQGNEIVDDDIDTIIEKGAQKAAEQEKKYREMKESDLRNLIATATEEAKAKEYTILKFEGEDYREKRKLAETQELLDALQLPPRRSKIMAKEQIWQSAKKLKLENVSESKDSPKPDENAKRNIFVPMLMLKKSEN